MLVKERSLRRNLRKGVTAPQRIIIMNTILVPTDFSENSKGGIRFAINMASLAAMKLLFIHVAPIVYSLDTSIAHQYMGFDTDEQTLRMREFIDSCYAEINIKSKPYDVVILEGIRADMMILEFCQTRHDIAYISISTRGASGLDKILGTNTGNLVTKSAIPVLVIPYDYLPSPIHLLLYASDFEDAFEEMDRVSTFARLFHARVEMLYIDNTTEDPERLTFNEIFNYPVHFRSVKKDIFKPFIEQLLEEVNIVRPDILILFTDHHRSFLEKLFNPILAEELAFRPLVPTLIFGKGRRD